MLVEIINAMFLERPTILVMDDISQSSLIIQTLLDLIEPFEWTFCIIPQILESLTTVLAAPFACLIGISTQMWGKLETEEIGDKVLEEISPDAAIFFLDK